VLGGSQAYGELCAPELVFGTQLGARLQQQHGVTATVIQAAARGVCGLQQAVLLEEELSRFAPKCIVWCLGDEDLATASPTALAAWQALRAAQGVPAAHETGLFANLMDGWRRWIRPPPLGTYGTDGATLGKALELLQAAAARSQAAVVLLLMPTRAPLPLDLRALLDQPARHERWRLVDLSEALPWRAGHPDFIPATTLLAPRGHQRVTETLAPHVAELLRRSMGQ
jgi:hypothetical protein